MNKTKKNVTPSSLSLGEGRGEAGFLNKIIKYSLNNRLIILAASVLLIIGGLYTAVNTEVDVFPDLNAPTVVIMTEANGMATEEVEQLVTFPIETAVNGATSVRRVRSSSTTGFSVVWVEFDWGTDIYLARQIVSEKLLIVNESLPPNVGNPTLGPQSSILGEMLIIGLTADSTSMLDLRTIADWTIRPRLLSTGGVAQVAVLGGDLKEYQILLSPERMKHYNVSLDEVMTATRGMNQNANGGVLYEFGNEYIVRGMLSTTLLEQLGKVMVKNTDNIPVLLEDISDIGIGAKTPKLGTASERGKAAVLLTVTKQPATSTLELTDKLEASLQDLQKNLPPDVKVSTNIFRQSRFIESSIGNVQRSLLEGGIFVVIILFLFLGNVRTTVISLVTLPLSLLVSILVLHYMGLTINTMSLGGMAIAIGSLVDDAIVDVENVFKRLRENKLKPQEEQESIIQVVFNASKEVRMPILNSTLIIVASFVPLFFLSGMEGRMLVPLGIAFIVALSASTVVALTLTPVLCSYLLDNNKGNKTLKESFIAIYLKGIYEKALVWTLKHKRLILGSTIGLFLVALICFFTLGRSFLPPFNEGSLTINVSSLPGISLEESDKMGHRAEMLLLTIPEIQTVARKTGRAELDEHALGVNTSEIEAPFELGKRSRSEFMAEVREKLGTITGANIEIGQPISHRIDAMLSGTQANIAIKLFGDDLNKMFALGNEIKSSIAGVEGIADLNVEQQIERPQLKITPKREIMAKYGISMPEFSEFVNVNFAGEVISQVYEHGKSFDLTVKVNDKNRDKANQIADLMIDTGDGKKVPLNYIADIRSSMGPNTISRENVKRKIVISANVADRDLRSVVNDIQKLVDEQISLPEGYHIEYGGQFESEQAASRTLLLTSIMSIIVIFLLLFNEFRNVKQSGIILLNLPLALIGGVFILLFTTGEISIPAIIGFISLFGIATRNGMLLVSRYNHLQSEEGMGLYDSIIHGSLDRLNPILMTALTSALALIPLALNGDLPGNEIQSPMAKVILGGLLTSTLLNGFIIPIVYLMMHTKKKGENV
ncbi:efflux RND transporter permease subunit [Bacteroides sp. 224]|uniref:efflux RND transporter permease subunit n=1 Tax=Bacteroides sp. 224 TaxID=2302936 RepID=UPI0013D20A5E|nr:efflux RND transporter permease subunit [Bacteroides sp. 224]NDV65632.1 efflux RND transporter permease subunit [Bacteroides sp. 224]